MRSDTSCATGAVSLDSYRRLDGSVWVMKRRAVGTEGRGEGGRGSAFRLRELARRRPAGSLGASTRRYTALGAGVDTETGLLGATVCTAGAVMAISKAAGGGHPRGTATGSATSRSGTGPRRCASITSGRLAEASKGRRGPRPVQAALSRLRVAAASRAVSTS